MSNSLEQNNFVLFCITVGCDDFSCKKFTCRFLLVTYFGMEQKRANMCNLFFFFCQPAKNKSCVQLQ